MASKVEAIYVKKSDFAAALQAISLLPGPKGETGIKGDQGLKGDKGDNGTNATTTALVTASTDGLMPKASYSKLDALVQSYCGVGYAALPALSISSTTDVVVTFSYPLPDATYKVTVIPVGLTSAQSSSTTITVPNKTTTSVTVRLSSTLGLSVNAGSLIVIATKNP